VIRRPRPILVALLLGAACVPALRAAGEAGNEATGPTLRVQGEAEVAVAPDRATVRLGATVQAQDAAMAQRQVNEIVQRALERIRAAGVPAENVQTAQLTLHPVYAPHRPPADGEEPSEPRISGYRATNTVEVTLDDLAKVGPVIDAGVAAGANELQGIQFGLRDDLPQRIAALKAATEEAQRKARAVAEAALVQLDGIREIEEGGSFVMRAQPDLRAAMVADSAGAPVEPGQVRVRASVTMTFSIAPRPAR
jgi:uncharacterized protein YggE